MGRQEDGSISAWTVCTQATGNAFVPQHCGRRLSFDAGTALVRLARLDMKVHPIEHGPFCP